MTAGVASGGTMLYSIDNTSWSGDVPTATNAGSYSVWYKVEGDANHTNVAAVGPVAVTVAKADNGLAVGNGPSVGVGSTFELSGLVSGADGDVAYSISTALENCSVNQATGAFSAGDKEGTCEVEITAAGDINHKSVTKTVTVTVTALPSIANATISFQNPQDVSIGYDGTAHRPAITVVHGETTLTADDYDVEYLNNVNVGTATARVTGKGSYVGTQDVSFTINQVSVASATATFPTQTYTGDKLEPTPTSLTVNGRELVADDYDITGYANNTNAGTATMTITGKGGYNGSATVEFSINPASVSAVEVDGTAYTYDGQAKRPVVTSVRAGDLDVTADSYDVVYANNVNAGTATVTVTGKGNFTGTKSATFRINPSSAFTVAAPAAQTYAGRALTPKPAVRLGSATLREGTDYALAYRNNVSAGTATVTVTGRGNYTGSKSTTFRIAPASLAKASVSAIPNQAYAGKALTPRPTVKVGSATLRLNTDYALSYRNNVNAGTATITVTGRGNYAGSRSATFRIVAPSVSYRTHVQNVGWQRYVADGAMSGTSGRSLRLEGINIKLSSMPVSGGIQYRTHIQNIGWQGWRSNGAMSGTSGRSLRLEAIQIRLTGNMAKYYDVYYRVHAQNVGWMGWAKNGAQAGTAGYSRRLEGIQIVLVPKGAKAPATTYRGIRQNNSRPFIKR